MRLRVLGAGLAVLALVAVLAAAASASFGVRHGGPMSGFNGAGVGWPSLPGAEFTWAMPLPDNSTMTDIVFESITPVGVEGLEVLGVRVSTDGCQIGTIATSYPPVGVSTISPNGVRLTALSKPCDVTTLVGVRRLAGSTSARIIGLQLRYQFEGATYEDVLPWYLDVKEPGP